MEIQPKKPSTKGPAELFTGDVWVDSIAQGQAPSRLSVGIVHFSPGARTLQPGKIFRSPVERGERRIVRRAMRPFPGWVRVKGFKIMLGLSPRVDIDLEVPPFRQ